MPKRKNEKLDVFNINDHKINNLSNLIELIDDLIEKERPSKKIRDKLPKKLYKLIDIYEDLIKLNSLIGLSDLKKQLLDQLLYFIEGDSEKLMMHTVIEGPPGTGKTTVSQIMANIYAGIGILKKNKLNIIKREDLIGQYLGETTLKTMDCLYSCKDSVMLIDEAYSLGSDSKGDIYSKEAIDAINQFLTEYSGKFICIIAGYKKELNDCFFSQNPGLRRRFPWTFTISNFNGEQLQKVYNKMCNLSEFTNEYTDDDLINIFTKNKSYFSGNGGDIENLLSRIKIIYNRHFFCKEKDYIISKNIFNESLKEFKQVKGNFNLDVPFGMYT